MDCQAGVGLVGSRMGGGPAAALRAHTALEDSIAKHFDGNHAINCMCHRCVVCAGTRILTGCAHPQPLPMGPSTGKLAQLPWQHGA